jgi:hypothetical protein
VTERDPGDLRAMMALLKALWKLRPPGEPEMPSARLVRRWREKRLFARLARGWPGGFTLHRTGDLVYVPSPLDARGRHALLHPPCAHPVVLGFLHPGSVVIDVGANLGEWTVPFARSVGADGAVIAIEPAPRSAAALEATLAANALRQAEVHPLRDRRPSGYRRIRRAARHFSQNRYWHCTHRAGSGRLRIVPRSIAQPRFARHGAQLGPS